MILCAHVSVQHLRQGRCLEAENKGAMMPSTTPCLQRFRPHARAYALITDLVTEGCCSAEKTREKNLRGRGRVYGCVLGTGE